MAAPVDSAGSYTITGLQAAPYIVIAAKDVDGSQTLTDGDYAGAYTSVSAPTPVTPPATNINITLEVYSGGGTPAPTPTPDDLTGTWTGTTTTPAPPQGFGTEQTTFEFTQSGSSISGTLTLTSSEGTFSEDVTGSVGSSINVSASFPLEDANGNPTGEAVTYAYEGVVSGSTYSGNVYLDDLVEGQFSVTRSSASTAPLDKALLNRIFRNVR